MSKPTSNPLWDTSDTNSVDPGAAKRANGYSASQLIASSDVNWNLQTLGDWVSHLEAGICTRGSIVDAIAESEAGDVVCLVADDVPWNASTIDSVTPGTSAPLYLDCDGTYVAWVSPTRDYEIRLAHMDTGYVRTISPSGGSPITSLMMDGSVIYATDGTYLYGLDYDGTEDYKVAETGVLRDVSQGYCLVWRSSSVQIISYDPSFVPTVQYTETGGTIPCALIARSTGLVFVYAAADSGGNNRIRIDGGVASQYSVTLSTATADGDFVAMWIHRGLLHVIIAGATNGSELWQIPVDLGAYNAQPFDEPTQEVLSSTAYDQWVMTPDYLVALDTGGNTYRIWRRRDLRDMGDQPTYGSAPYTRGVCDGQDLLLTQYSGTTAQIRRISCGAEAPMLRRYDATDWRPLCRSLAVGR